MSWIIPGLAVAPTHARTQGILEGCSPKGQLISEQIYAVLNFPKMQRNIARISALASRMGQIKKLKAQYHPKLFIIWYKKLPIFF